MNSCCEMCNGTGEGSGGWRGICGYCEGTGEGTCQECRYPATQDSPAGCINHGVTAAGREQAANLRSDRLARSGG